MESSSTKPNSGGKSAKRFRDECPCPNVAEIQKKQKIETKPLQLLDLNDDCLEWIFNKLSLLDLTSLAETHQRFIPAAEWVCVRRCRQKAVDMNFNKLELDDHGIPCETGRDSGIKFFRHFGQLVPKLSYNPTIWCDIESENAILSHCTDSLVYFCLINCYNAFEEINKPFENLKDLVISESVMGDKLSMLNIWFPNLTSLQLKNVDMPQPSLLEVNFPHLKHLNILNNLHYSIPTSTISKMLRLNPQLNSLIIKCDYRMEFIWLISKNLKHLENLELWLPEDAFLSFGEKITLESVKHFKLHWFSQWEGLSLNVPFIFPNLQELNLDGFHEFEESMINFILQNKSTKKLSLMLCCAEWHEFSYNDLTLITNKLPSLVELELWPKIDQMNELTTFLTQSNQLEKIKIHFKNRFHVRSGARINIEKKWTISKQLKDTNKKPADYYFILERKH